LENVPQLLAAGKSADGADGFLGILEQFVIKRGYEVSWAVIAAGAVGAPHRRRRLFLWVRKPTFHYEWPEGSLFYKPHDWSAAAEPVRMVPAEQSTDNHRCKRLMLLGNAVVPDCLRSAFFLLSSGFRKELRPDYTGTLVESPCESALKSVPLSVFHPSTSRSSIPKWGFARRASTDASTLEVFALKNVPERGVPQLNLVLTPKVFESGRRQQPHKGEPLPPLKDDLVMNAWSTPRSVTCGAHILTRRVARDLPTQVRYEVNTPDHLRSGQISADFVEWLMGYPIGWTRLPASWKTTSPVGYRPNGRGCIARARAQAQAQARGENEEGGGDSGDGGDDSGGVYEEEEDFLSDEVNPLHEINDEEH